jgi:hypothetical protein
MSLTSRFLFKMSLLRRIREFSPCRMVLFPLPGTQ